MISNSRVVTQAVSALEQLEGLKREIHVDGRVVQVRPGDLVFVPRWSMHQSRNTGSGELLLLAIADFGLTGKASIGDYLKTARMKNGAPQGVLQTL